MSVLPGWKGRLAGEIVKAIESDILGRSGIGNGLEECDDGIRTEIREAWVEIILDKLDEAAA